MSEEWMFDKAGVNMTVHRDIVGSIVQSNSSMSSLEILSRENEQNLVDARHDSTKPTDCIYEVKKLTGKDKDDFYAAIQMSVLEPHLDGAIKPTKPSMPKASGLTKDTTDDLDILIITHNNGLGLLGGEYAEDGTKERNFEALVKSYGLNQKSSMGGGGSHGVGKNVYWQWSKHGIVLFYSSLSKPYNDKGVYCDAAAGTTCNHTRRFIGTCRVKVPHYANASKYSAHGLLGIKRTLDGGDEAPISLFDDKADAIASTLNIPLRTSADPGVTIVIVGFQDPQNSTTDMVFEAIQGENTLRESSEKNWFPAKLSKALEVKVQDLSPAPIEQWGPEVGRSYKLLEWLDKGLDEEKGPLTQGVFDPTGSKGATFASPQPSTYKRVEIDLVIPRDYPGNPTNNVLRSKAVLGLMIVDDHEYPVWQESPELGDDVWGTTACIRHTGMVVTYKPFIQRPSKMYRAVLLVGKSVELFDGKLKGTLDANAQSLGEEMMKFSEPAVHDDWQPKGFTTYVQSNGTLDPAYSIVAKSGQDRIKEFLKEVERQIREALGILPPPKAKKSADWVDLSKSLDFGNSNSESGGRIISIKNVKIEKTGKSKASLSFKVEVPALGTAQGWNSKTTHWWLDIKPKLRWPSGKMQTPPTTIVCFDFEALLDDTKHAKMSKYVKVNYTTALAKWKKTTETAAITMDIDEWEGDVNKLSSAPLLSKKIKMSFTDIEIDLTDYENAILELSIEAGEVR